MMTEKTQSRSKKQRPNEDKYANFAELAKSRRKGTDFDVRTEDRNSGISVLAIHGGAIEPGTSELAREIAGIDMNLFLFEGLMGPRRNGELHITSTNFDQPDCVALVQRSQSCVSVHGAAGVRNKIYVGGGDKKLRLRMADCLRRAFPKVEVESEGNKFGGESPYNIVNRCANKGVQLELSRSLRNVLLKRPDDMRRMADVIRRAILDE